MRRPTRPLLWAVVAVPLLAGAGLLASLADDGDGVEGAVTGARAVQDGVDLVDAEKAGGGSGPSTEPTSAAEVPLDDGPPRQGWSPGRPSSDTAAEPPVEPEPAPAPAPPSAPAPAPAPAAPAPAPAPAAPAVATRDVERRLLALADDARRAAGVAPLQAHDGLADVARRWSERLAAEGRSLAHNPDYATQVPGGWSAVGENVAWIDDGGTLSPEEVARRIHQGWMDSAGHRENILRPGYTHLGVGVGHHPAHGWYLTQNFATY
jgi:uncharacterized protein YkwD